MTEPNPPVSLKAFLLQVALWLPLSFYFWFLWSGLFVSPVGFMLEPVIGAVLGDALRDVYQSAYFIVIEVYFEPPDGTRLELNPMIFGYGLPLLAGLAIAAPKPIWRRAVDLLVAWIVIALVQCWGLFWEALHQLQSYTGEAGLAVVRSTGVPAELIVFGYQFGYLILPAVVPVVLWLLMNRRFVESLVQLPGSEPPKPDDGQLDSSD